MKVYKTRGLARFCKSEGITDQQLADAIARAERGLIDAALGGGLIKQRVARKGQGRSGGWRTLIAYLAGHRAVFLFGFAKNERDNIGDDQLALLKAAASEVLALTPKEITARLDAETLTEVPFGKQD